MPRWRRAVRVSAGSNTRAAFKSSARCGQTSSTWASSATARPCSRRRKTCQSCMSQQSPLRGAAIVVPERSRVQSVGELRGKRVAVNRAAQAHYLLLKALDEANVDVGELEICFEPPERALRAFQAGAIDAWAIWDPWLSSARLDFGARVLRDASGLLNNSAYYVARRDFAERSNDLVEELLTQLQMAAHWAKKEPSRAADLLAPGLGFSSRALIASLDRDLRPVQVSSELIDAQQDVADTLLRMQLIPRAVSVTDAQWRLRPTG